MVKKKKKKDRVHACTHTGCERAHWVFGAPDLTQTGLPTSYTHSSTKTEDTLKN